MPIDWAIADTANRLSVVQLADICTKVEVEKTLFRLGKKLGHFPMATLATFLLIQLPITFELLMIVQ